jgi:hypothetical protein
MDPQKAQSELQLAYWPVFSGITFRLFAAPTHYFQQKV